MRLIMLGFLLLLSACTTGKDYNRSLSDWRGQDIKQVMPQLGTPDKIKKGLDGSTIYTFNTEGYTTQKQPPRPAVGVNFSGSGTPVMVVPNADSLANTTPIASICIITITADKNNKIISANAIGDGCRN
jgi:hypothetical protein